MDKRTEFKLRFSAPSYADWDTDDWTMILRTTEPVSENDIRYLIDVYKKQISEYDDDYSPLDILDEICDEKGWDWEDSDWNEVVIDNWQ